MKHRRLLKIGAISTVLFLILNICCIAEITLPKESVAVDNNEVTIKEKIVSKTLISEFNVPDIVGIEKAQKNKHKYRLAEEPNLYTLIFENEDGSRTLYNFGEAVKYEKDGKIFDKSNRLSRVSYRNTVYYSNTQNNIVSYLPEQLSDGIFMNMDGYQLSIQPLEVSVTKSSADKDSVVYPEAYGSYSALKYSALYSGLKEEIILSQYTGITEFSFLLNTGDCIIKELDDDCLYLFDRQKNEYRGLIEPVYIEDANGKIETDNELLYRQVSATEWIITVKANREFLESPTTQYPVSIDPTITQSTTSIQDATVYSGGVDEAVGASGALFIGKRSDYLDVSRVLMKFPNLSFPSEVTASSISSAEVTLRDLMCEAEALSISCHEFKGNIWDESTVSWTTSGMLDLPPYNYSYNTTPVDTKTVSYSIGITLPEMHRYSFNITNIVKEWTSYGTSEKRKGIMFKSTDESLERVKTFASFNRAAYNPTFTMTYGTVNPRTVSDGTYYIRNKKSGKYLEVESRAAAQGAKVTQWSFNGYFNQQWKVTYRSDGYYTLEPAHTTGYALDVKNNYQQVGSLIDIWGTGSPPNVYVKFIIAANGDGTYRIISKVSNDKMCLTVKFGSMENSADVIQSNYTNAPSQQWYFESEIYDRNRGFKYSPYSENCGYQSSDIRVQLSCGDYTSYARDAINAWNAAVGEGNELSITEDSSSDNTIQIHNGSFDISSALGRYVSKSKNSSTRRTTRFTIYIYYTRINDECDRLHYTAAQKENHYRGIIAHEIGHAFGLDDNPLYFGTVPLMRQGNGARSNYGPQKPDIAGAYRFNKFNEPIND